MQIKELDQFMVDFHASSDVIEVNAQWLQSQLAYIHTLKQDLASVTAFSAALRTRNSNLEIALSTASAYYNNRVRLNVQV